MSGTYRGGSTLLGPRGEFNTFDPAEDASRLKYRKKKSKKSARKNNLQEVRVRRKRRARTDSKELLRRFASMLAAGNTPTFPKRIDILTQSDIENAGGPERWAKRQPDFERVFQKALIKLSKKTKADAEDQNTGEGPNSRPGNAPDKRKKSRGGRFVERDQVQPTKASQTRSSQSSSSIRTTQDEIAYLQKEVSAAEEFVATSTDGSEIAQAKHFISVARKRLKILRG